MKTTIEELIRFMNLDWIDEQIRFELFCKNGHVPDLKYKWVTKNRNEVFSEEFLKKVANGEEELSEHFFENNEVVN